MPKLDLPATVTAAYLNELRAQFETGDTPSLFQAMTFCARQDLALPDWAAHAFLIAMSRWWSLDAATLDDAFGIQWPKGKQVAAARKKRRLSLAVYNDVRQSVSSSGCAISATLFANIGRRHNIGKTLAEEYYYAAKKTLESIPESFDALLTPYMTPAAKQAASSRKITKLRGSRSKIR